MNYKMNRTTFAILCCTLLFIFVGCDKKNEIKDLEPSAELLQNTIWKGVKENYSNDGKKIVETFEMEFVFYTKHEGFFKRTKNGGYMGEWDFKYTVEKKLLSFTFPLSSPEKWIILEFNEKQMKLQDIKSNSIITLHKQN